MSQKLFGEASKRRNKKQEEEKLNRHNIRDGAWRHPTPTPLIYFTLAEKNHKYVLLWS